MRYTLSNMKNLTWPAKVGKECGEGVKAKGSWGLPDGR